MEFFLIPSNPHKLISLRYLKNLFPKICLFVFSFIFYCGNEVETTIEPKWKCVSIHTARRSYVGLLRTAGLGLDIIARATAHSSILQTDEYNKLDYPTLKSTIQQGWVKILSN
jgi:integrase